MHVDSSLDSNNAFTYISLSHDFTRIIYHYTPLGKGRGAELEPQFGGVPPPVLSFLFSEGCLLPPDLTHSLWKLKQRLSYSEKEASGPKIFDACFGGEFFYFPELDKSLAREEGRGVGAPFRLEADSVPRSVWRPSRRNR